jgi:hypothetical protein
MHGGGLELGWRLLLFVVVIVILAFIDNHPPHTGAAPLAYLLVS